MPGVVDADTHVLESQDMWDDFDDGGEMYPYRPLLVNLPGDTSWGGRNAFKEPVGRQQPSSATGVVYPSGYRYNALLLKSPRLAEIGTRR